jgi:hypothetical protein
VPQPLRRLVHLIVSATTPALALILVITASSVATTGWSRTTRVIDGTYREVSMDIDSNGKVHAAARGDSGLWYLTNRTGAWTRTRLTYNPLDAVDQHPSLDVDDAGRVHVVFSRYVGPAAGGVIEDLYYLSDVTGPAGTFPEDAKFLAPGNRPSLRVVDGVRYLAYGQWAWWDEGGKPTFASVVRYATAASGPWSHALVERYAARPSLAVASNGHARLAFEDTDDGGIRYAVAGSVLGNFASQWATSNPREAAPRLALDGNDRPHMAWTRNGSSSAGGGSYYAKQASGTWVGGRFTTVKWDVQLALDSRNKPQLAVLGPAEGVFFYRLVDGSLKRQTLSAAAIATSVGLRIGGNGKPVVLYTTDGGVPDGVYHTRKT